MQALVILLMMTPMAAYTSELCRNVRCANKRGRCCSAGKCIYAREDVCEDNYFKSGESAQTQTPTQTQLLYPTERTPFMEGGPGVSFRTTCALLTNVRYDPVVSPGQVSAHVHGVYGSTAFGSRVSADELWTTTETTCNYPQAKSVYWAPALYFRNPLTKRYELIPSYTFHYYQQTSSRFNDNYMRQGNKMHAWPLGFRIKYGDASRRGGTIGERWSGKRSDAQWMCSTGQFDNPRDAKGRFPGLTKDGKICQEWQARMFYPECWDGKSLDSPDHASHAQYMQGMDGCPRSHPILLPTLKFQVHYNVGPIIAKYRSAGLTASDFVLSTGDNTGASMHSDFISGWDPEVLTDLLRGCSKNGPDGQKLGESFKCPADFKSHTLPHPFLEKYVPKIGSLRMQARPVNEAITDVRCLPGNNGCL